jgi:hypothetical protein
MLHDRGREWRDADPLLSAKPDFIDMFVQIGRVGRSLGVHLLLASQRLDEGRLRGLETHLSYRIALRTLSTMESRLVLGVADHPERPHIVVARPRRRRAGSTPTGVPPSPPRSATPYGSAQP